jgi:hypothetical protein
MSGHDVLARASRALCDQARERSAEASRTRALVMLRASRRARRSRATLVLLPIAAVLAMSTAWASTQGHGVAMWTRVESLLVSGEKKVELRTRARPPAVHQVASVATPEEPASLASIPELPVDALPPAPRAPSRMMPSVPAQTMPPARADDAHSAASPREPSIGDAASRLYAAAHHAHFVERNPPEALRAWDAFLAFAPDDPLAPEARYNRALTLVRLDRRADARLALEPFARGAYGQYRMREARALLDALAP